MKNYIIGHSERVKHQGEKLNIINKKLKLIEEKGAKAIVCVGDKKDNIFSEFLIMYQLKKIFKNIVTDNIVIAYEPVYSIGTGKILSRKKIEQRIKLIKKYFYLSEIFVIFVLLKHGSMANYMTIKYIMTPI